MDQNQFLLNTVVSDYEYNFFIHLHFSGKGV